MTPKHDPDCAVDDHYHLVFNPVEYLFPLLARLDDNWASFIILQFGVGMLICQVASTLLVPISRCYRPLCSILLLILLAQLMTVFSWCSYPVICLYLLLGLDGDSYLLYWYLAFSGNLRSFGIAVLDSDDFDPVAQWWILQRQLRLHTGIRSAPAITYFVCRGFLQCFFFGIPFAWQLCLLCEGFPKGLDTVCLACFSCRICFVRLVGIDIISYKNVIGVIVRL